jgi:hypothetical protein
MKVAALSGQVVLVPLRPFLIGNPLEDSLVDQPAKTVGENLPRYAGHAGIFPFHEQFVEKALEFLA